MRCPIRGHGSFSFEAAVGEQKKSSRPLFARDVRKGRSGRICEKLRKMCDFCRATPVESDGFTNSEEAVAAAGHGSRPCWLKCCPCPSSCSLSLIRKKYLFCALHISLPLFPLSLYPTLRSLAVVPAAHSSLDMTADKEDKDGAQFFSPALSLSSLCRIVQCQSCKKSSWGNPKKLLDGFFSVGCDVSRARFSMYFAHAEEDKEEEGVGRQGRMRMNAGLKGVVTL